MRSCSALAEAVNRLVDEYRQRCLWFLRSDYYPATDGERLRVLRFIETYGDSEAYRRSAEVRRWLSPTSSERSAELGRCVLNAHGALFRGDTKALHAALERGGVAFHRGRIRGALPSMRPGP